MISGGPLARLCGQLASENSALHDAEPVGLEQLGRFEVPVSRHDPRGAECQGESSSFLQHSEVVLGQAFRVFEI